VSLYCARVPNTPDTAPAGEYPRALWLITSMAIAALQFALGHLLGFGGRGLAGSSWSLVVIALGNATGVYVAGLIAARMLGRPGPRRARAAMGALAGSGAGVAILMVLPPLGYVAVLLPLLLSIAAFHAASAMPAVPIASQSSQARS
jgi:hypothetical protein